MESRQEDQTQFRKFDFGMSTSASGNIGTGAVRPAHRFDETALGEWMSENIAGYRGPLHVAQFNGGQSNPTYRLTTPERSYVLRRKPPGKLIKGAHAIEREAEVLAALGRVGFPVARVLGLCTENSVIGSWFYIMDMVEGRIFWDASLTAIPPAERPAYYDAMNATIANLHNIDYRAVGLADFGRGGGYCARQISRWTQQYNDDPDAGRDPEMDWLVDWLPAHIPADDRACLTHGDFRIDNIIFHPTEPRVLAVLDWELSTVGHPHADFAYHAMMYHVPPHLVAGLGGADLGALNLPRESDYLADYCRRTGLDAIPDYDFYLTFNLFRLAAILHGIKGRALRGTASSQQAAERAKVWPEVARMARAQVSSEG